MYSVAINTQLDNTFSMTVRDFERSTHWKEDLESITMVYFDSREAVMKPFTEIAKFNTETEARKFAAVIEAAYLAAGWERDTVKVQEEA